MVLGLIRSMNSGLPEMSWQSVAALTRQAETTNGPKKLTMSIEGAATVAREEEEVTLHQDGD